LERLTARAAMERAHAKDLLAVGSTLKSVLAIHALLTGEMRAESAESIQALVAPISGHAEEMGRLVDLLDRSISDEPSILLTEGNLIRKGYDAELDRLNNLKDNARGV